MMGPWRGSHKLEHDQLGIPAGFATLPAVPSAAADYAALGVGAIAAGIVHFAGNRTVAEPFAMPYGGVVEDITVIGYGNAGNTGTACFIRWGIAALLPDPTSSIGLRVGDILASDAAAILNTSEGFVTLASGLSVVVPPLFCVLIKQGYTTTTAEQFSVRRAQFPAAMPGLPAILGGTFDLISSAQMRLVATDVTTPIPAAFSAGALEIAYNHRPAAAVKWRAA